jgi:hypothetical protein
MRQAELVKPRAGGHKVFELDAGQIFRLDSASQAVVACVAVEGTCQAAVKVEEASQVVEVSLVAVVAYPSVVGAYLGVIAYQAVVESHVVVA